MRAVLLALLLVLGGWTAVRADGLPGPRLEAFERVSIELPQRAAGRVALRAYGRAFELVLSDNADLIGALPPRLRDRLPGDDRFLRGELAGIDGSWVRLNRIGGRVSGAFHDGEHLYLIDRAGGFRLPAGRRAPAGATLVFRLADLRPDAPIDAGGVRTDGSVAGHGAVFDDYATFSAHLRELAVLEGTAAMALPITVVSDRRFGRRYGANTESVVVGRVNLIDGIYGQQVGVGIQLLHHERLADDGPMTATDASGLLSQFRGWMDGGAGSGVPFEGLGHLFTARDLDGGTVGIAFLNVLCSSRAGYGVNQDYGSDTYAALIFAHEVGHNFGAYHDDDRDSCPDGTIAGIMNSRITGADDFSQCSLDAMAPSVAGASCLVSVESTETIFGNGFEP